MHVRWELEVSGSTANSAFARRLFRAKSEAEARNCEPKAHIS